MDAAVKQRFHDVGISLDEKWVEECCQWLRQQMGPTVFDGLGDIPRSDKVLRQLLLSDLEELPRPPTPLPSRSILEGSKECLPSSYVVQLLEVVDISKPPNNDELKEEGGNTGNRCLQLHISDGVARITAIEKVRVGVLKQDTPPGTKILLRRPYCHQGTLLLKPESVVILGGQSLALLSSISRDNATANGDNITNNSVSPSPSNDNTTTTPAANLNSQTSDTRVDNSVSNRNGNNNQHRNINANAVSDNRNTNTTSNNTNTNTTSNNTNINTTSNNTNTNTTRNRTNISTTSNNTNTNTTSNNTNTNTTSNNTNTNTTSNNTNTNTTSNNTNTNTTSNNSISLNSTSNTNTSSNNQDHKNGRSAANEGGESSTSRSVDVARQKENSAPSDVPARTTSLLSRLKAKGPKSAAAANTSTKSKPSTTNANPASALATTIDTGDDIDIFDLDIGWDRPAKKRSSSRGITLPSKRTRRIALPYCRLSELKDAVSPSGVVKVKACVVDSVSQGGATLLNTMSPILIVDDGTARKQVNLDPTLFEAFTGLTKAKIPHLLSSDEGKVQLKRSMGKLSQTLRDLEGVFSLEWVDPSRGVASRWLIKEVRKPSLQDIQATLG